MKDSTNKIALRKAFMQLNQNGERLANCLLDLCEVHPVSFC